MLYYQVVVFFFFIIKTRDSRDGATTKECRKAIKERNKSFRILKKTLNFETLIKYKQCQAVVRCTVKKAKREYWKAFCETLDRTTPIGNVWGMIKRMRGIRKELEYPIMMVEDRVIIGSKDKAEAIAKTLVKVHSSGNLTPIEARGREITIDRYRHVLEEEMGNEDAINTPFDLSELNSALKKVGRSTPGRDGICYVMLEKLTDKGKEVVLGLINKVWVEGVIPAEWKLSVIIPIRKPGKDATMPSNYRPIALTSQLAK